MDRSATDRGFGERISTRREAADHDARLGFQTPDPARVRRARLTVARSARDAQDCRDLLEMLGLLDEEAYTALSTAHVIKEPGW